MHTLASVFEIMGLLILLMEAIGERRAARWRQELAESEENLEEMYRDLMGDRFGRGMWALTLQRVSLRVATSLASMIADFDEWKDRHGLSDALFLFGVLLGAAGIVLS